MEVAAVKPPVRPVHIGFRLGPRLNAAGRLGTAQAALELLSTADETRARDLAVGAGRTRTASARPSNSTRSLEAQTQLATALRRRRRAAARGHRGRRAGWHPGVLGIVASRLMRSHHRPTLVVGFDEKGMGKGSGRSIEGLSLVGCAGGMCGLLEKFGGHEMAAG